MSAARNTMQPALLFLTTFTMLVSLAGAQRALAAEPRDPARAQAVTSACKIARQQAWFERQLRRTDGDTEPLQPPEPAACKVMDRP